MVLLWLVILLVVITLNIIWAILCWLYYKLKPKPTYKINAYDYNYNCNAYEEKDYIVDYNNKNYKEGLNIGYKEGWIAGYNKCKNDYNLK